MTNPQMTKKKVLLHGAAIICFIAATNWAWVWAFWDINRDRDPSLLMMNVAIWPALGLAALSGRCLWDAVNG